MFLFLVFAPVNGFVDVSKVLVVLFLALKYSKVIKVFCLGDLSLKFLLLKAFSFNWRFCSRRNSWDRIKGALVTGIESWSRCCRSCRCSS